MVEVKFSDVKKLDHIIIFVDNKLNLPTNIKVLESNIVEGVKNLLNKSKDFTGKLGEIKSFSLFTQNHYINLVAIGIGDLSELNDRKLENLGGKLYKIGYKSEEVDVIPFTDNHINSTAFGFLLGSYRFDKYKTKQDDNLKLKVANFIVQNPAHVSNDFVFYKHLQEAIFWTRDLVNEVPNVLTTQNYADKIVAKMKTLGVETEVLDAEQMKNLGMNALLGVAQGSVNKAKLVVMKYNNSGDKKQPIALVGKGVTFDTGGISLKPSEAMHLMKYDMAGSAAVVGAISALAMLKAKVNVVAAVAIVENMPDGNAQRPGDIVTTMSGQTVEVLNTDAEGRLILCDAMWYIQDKFKPAKLIDLATLTGAIVVALGSSFAGCFSNDNDLADKLIQAGKDTGELLWQMPLHEDYSKLIESDFADIANIGSGRGMASSSTAAHFLEKFVNKIPWAHLDIAGMAWEKGGKDTCPKGATGYGVRLLVKFIQDNYA